MKSTKVDWKYDLAETISVLANPALVMLGGLLLIIYHFAPNLDKFYHWSLISCLLLFVPSSLFLAYLWSKEEQIDIDVSKRQDRFVPMMLMTLGAIVGGFMVQRRLDNVTLTALSFTLSALLMILTITTFVWKISLHAATLAATVSLLVAFGGMNYAWIYLLLIPVVWSRLVLKKHTPAQVTAGTLVGIIVTFLTVGFFKG